MGKWKMVRLGDVCDSVSSNIAQKDLNDNEGVYPIYGASGLIKHVDFYRQKNEYIAVIKDGAGIGRTTLLPAQSSVIGTMQALIPRDIVNTRYLYFAISSMNLAKYYTGTTIPHIYFKDYKSEMLPLPPLDVQKKIADVLDKASTLIELRRAQLDKLDLLIKSQFIEMFGDPVTNPMGWEIGTIRDLVSEVKYGTSRPAEADGKYIYLRMNNITYNGSIDLSDIKYINIGDKEFDKYIVRKGDLLFNRTNSKELVGKTAVFKEDTPMIIAGYIIRVRTNEKANPEYISAYLNSQYGKSTLLGMCKAIVGQANINAQELQNIKIPLTPVSLQNEYAVFVEQVEEKKKLLKQSLSQLQRNYKSLMQKCFRGELF